MPAIVLDRPAADEHMPYYTRYISRVPAGNLVQLMTEQIGRIATVFRPIDSVKAGHAYAPGKWTIREVLGHLVDVERVFGYRATAISRADPAPLPSFEQDDWLPYGRYNDRPLGDILDEWETARRALIALVKAMPEEALSRRGRASDAEVTVRALVHIPPGHATYHLELLARDYGIPVG